MNNPPKVQKILNLLIQLAIFASTYLFIYHQVFQKGDIPGLLVSLENFMAEPGFKNGLLLVGLMMIVNWSLEALKWKYLIGKVEVVSFFNAFQAVLTGISVSSVIPNRVGEFFGRIYILKTASRIEGILITLVGSMSQLLITVIAGSAAMLIFIRNYLPDSGFSHGYLFNSLAVIIVTLDIILVSLFFRVSILAALKERILKNGLKRWQKYLGVFAFYHNRELAAVVLLSLTRYLVFSTQFYILLRLFHISIPYPDALLLISLVYFIMAMIPTIALTELGIRGSVALYIFGIYFGQGLTPGGSNSIGVLAASTLLWLINLGIPALIGTVFVFRLKFFRKSAG